MHAVGVDGRGDVGVVIHEEKGAQGTRGPREQERRFINRPSRGGLAPVLEESDSCGMRLQHGLFRSGAQGRLVKDQAEPVDLI